MLWPSESKLDISELQHKMLNTTVIVNFQACMN
jgi:hypothetical protein